MVSGTRPARKKKGQKMAGLGGTGILQGDGVSQQILQRSMVMRRLGFVILGLVLLTTAGLKVWGLGASPDPGWWTGWQVRLFIIEWEVVLGLWLMSGVRPVVGWLAAVVTFAGFAGLSGFLGLRGVLSCGCFGATQASPWWAFAVDVVALALLLQWRPEWKGFGGRVRTELGGTRPLAVAAGAVAVVGVVAFTHLTEASDELVARVRGDTLTIRPTVIDVGVGSPNEVREGTAVLSNWTDRPVRIFGGTTGCNYNILSDCPMTIPARSSAQFRVRYRLAESVGRSTQKAAFWAVSESGGAVSVALVLSGETTAKSK
jgi:hypothetical protein